MAPKNIKLSLEEALTRYLAQLDTQVAREMQRSPSEREDFGVQKWEPYRKRVERVASILVEQFGKEAIHLDSLLISAEAFSTVLRILAEEIGEKGFGSVRSSYIREVFKSIERDIELSKSSLGQREEDTLN